MELETLNLSDEQLAGVQQILQSEGDRIRTKYSNELRTVKEELKQYKRHAPQPQRHEAPAG